MTMHPFDDAAPMIRLPVYRGPGRSYGRGDGKLVMTDPPSRDVPPFRGCPHHCSCQKCRLDAEATRELWDSLHREREHAPRRGRPRR